MDLDAAEAAAAAAAEAPVAAEERFAEAEAKTTLGEKSRALGVAMKRAHGAEAIITHTDPEKLNRAAGPFDEGHFQKGDEVRVADDPQNVKRMTSMMVKVATSRMWTDEQQEMLGNVYTVADVDSEGHTILLKTSKNGQISQGQA